MKYYYEAIRELFEANKDGQKSVGNLQLKFVPQTEQFSNKLIIFRSGYVLSHDLTIPLKQTLDFALRELIRSGQFVVKSIVSVEEQKVIGPEVCTVFSWRWDKTKNILSFSTAEHEAATSWLKAAQELKEADEAALAEIL